MYVWLFVYFQVGFANPVQNLSQKGSVFFFISLDFFAVFQVFKKNMKILLAIDLSIFHSTMRNNIKEFKEFKIYAMMLRTRM